MFIFPFLGVLRKFEIVLAFSKMFSFDSGSSIKLLSNKIEIMFPLRKYFTSIGRAIICADLEGINKDN